MTDSSDLFPRALSFMLGKLYIADQVHEVLGRSGPSVVTLLERHARGDWGSVTLELRERNQSAVLNGFRIRSYFRTSEGGVISIRTNAARTETHVEIEDDEAEGLL